MSCVANSDTAATFLLCSEKTGAIICPHGQIAQFILARGPGFALLTLRLSPGRHRTHLYVSKVYTSSRPGSVHATLSHVSGPQIPPRYHSTGGASPAIASVSERRPHRTEHIQGTISIHGELPQVGLRVIRKSQRDRHLRIAHTARDQSPTPRYAGRDAAILHNDAGDGQMRLRDALGQSRLGEHVAQENQESGQQHGVAQLSLGSKTKRPALQALERLLRLARARTDLTIDRFVETI